MAARLAQKQERADQEEEHQRPAGHVLQAEHEQHAGQGHGIQGVGAQKTSSLPVEADGPVGAVQSRHAIGNEAQHHRQQAQIHIIGKWDALDAGEYIKADEIGDHHGDKHQHTV